jgi:hypothetical protein
MPKLVSHRSERAEAIFWTWVSVAVAVAAWPIGLLAHDLGRAIVVGVLGFIIMAVVRSSSELPTWARRLMVIVYLTLAASFVLIMFGPMA